MSGPVATDTIGMNTNNNCTNVFVVDDSLVFRERLVSLLGETEGITVVGQAECPIGAIDGIVRTNPDAVVLDIHLHNGSGIDVMRGLRYRTVGTVFIVLTNFPSPQHRKFYLEAGATYFLDKLNEFKKVAGIISSLGSTRGKRHVESTTGNMS